MVAPSANTFHNIKLYVCAFPVHLFFKFFNDVVIEYHFIFFEIFHVKVLDKIPLIVCGLMLKNKLFICNGWNVGFERFAALDIYVGEWINRWVWKQGDWNGTNSFAVALVEMHVGTDVFVTDSHLEWRGEGELKINFICFYLKYKILFWVL